MCGEIMCGKCSDNPGNTKKCKTCSEFKKHFKSGDSRYKSLNSYLTKKNTAYAKSKNNKSKKKKKQRLNNNLISLYTGNTTAMRERRNSFSGNTINNIPYQMRLNQPNSPTYSIVSNSRKAMGKKKYKKHKKYTKKKKKNKNVF